jgi:hypothetical protein
LLAKESFFRILSIFCLFSPEDWGKLEKKISQKDVVEKESEKLSRQSTRNSTRKYEDTDKVEIVSRRRNGQEISERNKASATNQQPCTENSQRNKASATKEHYSVKSSPQ